MVDISNAKQYKILMTNRESIVVEGVENVETFDDKEIVLETKQGVLILKGDDLHIIQLNLSEGTLTAEGYCKSLDFVEERKARGLKNKGKGLVDRILR